MELEAGPAAAVKELVAAAEVHQERAAAKVGIEVASVVAEVVQKGGTVGKRVDAVGGRCKRRRRTFVDSLINARMLVVYAHS